MDNLITKFCVYLLYVSKSFEEMFVDRLQENRILFFKGFAPGPFEAFKGLQRGEGTSMGALPQSGQQC